MLISAADATGFINLEVLFLFTPVVFYLPWKINVAGGKEIVINKPVNCPLTDHDRVLIICADMIDGLSFSDQRRNQLIQMGDFFFGIRDAGP